MIVASDLSLLMGNILLTSQPARVDDGQPVSHWERILASEGSNWSDWRASSTYGEALPAKANEYSPANHITYTTQNAYGRRSFSLCPTQTQHQSCGLAENCIDKTRCGLPWRRAPIHRRFGGCRFKIQHTNIVNASSNNFEGSHQALSFKDCEIKECLHRRGESQQSTKRRCLH